MGPQLTRDNHVMFEDVPQDGGRLFCIAVGEAPASVPRLFEQAVTDARHFYESSREKNIVLCLSGGIDSECMLLAFLAAQVPFTVAFLKFKNDLNLFDIETNIALCEARGIRHDFVDLDIIEFYDSGRYMDVARKYECQSPQIAAHLWLLDQLDGAPCLGGNPIAPIWRDGGWFFVGLPGELHSTYFKYFLTNSREGLPWFFIYSPQMIKSYFALEVMRPYLKGEVTSIEAYTYMEKCRTYQQGGFNTEPRRNKFTGFELVREHYDKKHGTQFGTSYDQLFRRPLEGAFPFPDHYIQLIPKSYFASAHK